MGQIYGLCVFLALLNSGFSSEIYTLTDECDTPTIDGAIYEPFYSTYEVSKRVVVKCLEGRKLSGPDLIVCLPGGEWTSYPTCEETVAHCPYRKLKNGVTSPELDSYNRLAVVSYMCSTGYVRLGSSNALCMSDGRWSHALPVCKELVTTLDCPQPELSNGFTTPNLSSYKRLATVTYSCSEGYKLSGSAMAVCMSKGKWSHPFPVCEEEIRGCPALSVENGRIFPVLAPDEKYYSIHQSVSYFCDPGYVLSGMVTSRCSPGGIWSNTISFCAAGCEPPIIPYGEVTPALNGPFDYYKVEDVITFQCQSNYDLSGSSYAECLAGGKWSPSFPTCEVFHDPQIPEEGCEPPIIEHGSVFSRLPSGQKIFRIGDTARINCDENYIRDKRFSFITCVSNGKWDMIESICKPVPETGCEPPDIEHGIYTPSLSMGKRLFAVGIKLTFRCLGDFKIRGSKYATCLATGIWNNRPICHDGCKPQLVLNGGISPRLPSGKVNYKFGTIIALRCASGFLLHGSSTATCLQTGIWSGSLKCSDGCRHPRTSHIELRPSPVQGTDFYRVGSKINFSCSKGYLLRGVKEATCNSGDKWDRMLPFCIEIRPICHGPEELKMGSYQPVKKVYGEGERVSWFCREGFTRRGAAISECTKSGNFYPKTPRCIRIVVNKRQIFDQRRQACRAPAPPEGGMIKSKNNNKVIWIPLGKEVEFACEKGYHMVGTARAICRRTGYAEQFPTCNLVQCKPPQVPNDGFIVDEKEEYFYGEDLFYECNENYIMRGSNSSSCQENGQFSPRSPVCRPPSCRMECDFAEKRSCQCDAACVYDNTCCDDFDQYCRKLFY